MAKKVTSKKGKVARKMMPAVGDVITIEHVGPGAAVAAGRAAKASVTNQVHLSPVDEWVTNLTRKIDSLSSLSQAEKEDLRQQVEKIGMEARKGSQAEVGRLEKLINTLSIMAPDIFEVAVATLSNPLSGIGLVIKKIGDKAQLERK